MGKADKHIARVQEMNNRSQIFTPYQSTSKFDSMGWLWAVNNQGKLASDIMKRGKRK